MTYVRPLLSLLSVPFLLLSVFAGGLAAQDLRFVHPEKFERATKADDNGVLQWAEHEQVKCPTCSGTGKFKCPTCERFFDDAPHCIECKRTKEAVCRACAGAGHFADPLEKVLCPGCQGAGFLLCGLCNGGGRIKGEGSGDRWSTCPACRGDGGWKCGCCAGNRLVDSVPLKPSLKEANVAALDKAIATTDQVLVALQKWSPAEHKSSRKAVKELLKELKVAEAVYPAMKKLPKTLEDAMSKTAAGAQYQKQEEREGEIMGGVKNSAEYFLKHQKRMMELAKKRQEANAKLAEEK
ncbi:MAG: hypothetical protein JNL08_12455 [Planctomycetes bacterium]|nr:hypothetical protein [Planctomycetota bacterium]